MHSNLVSAQEPAPHLLVQEIAAVLRRSLYSCGSLQHVSAISLSHAPIANDFGQVFKKALTRQVCFIGHVGHALRFGNVAQCGQQDELPAWQVGFFKRLPDSPNKKSGCSEHVHHGVIVANVSRCVHAATVGGKCSTNPRESMTGFIQ